MAYENLAFDVTGEGDIVNRFLHELTTKNLFEKKSQATQTENCAVCQDPEVTAGPSSQQGPLQGPLGELATVEFATQQGNKPVVLYRFGETVVGSNEFKNKVKPLVLQRVVVRANVEEYSPEQKKLKSKDEEK